MRITKSFTMTEDMAEIVREMAFAMECSESSFTERAIQYFIKHGLEKSVTEECQKKREAISSVVQAIKQGRNPFLQEVGNTYEQD